ncbi:MAG: hypothetical protein Aurels2KO_12290 [Aureliella sp.]
MDESTQNAIEAVASLIQAIVLLGGICWAIYRFRAEGTHKPRIEKRGLRMCSLVILGLGTWAI